MKAFEFHREERARVLAALHNGPLIRKDQSMWTADMFLPGYQAKPAVDQSWRTVKQQIAASQKRMTPEERQVLAEREREFQRRSMEAQAAKARGASAQDVIQIMEGGWDG